MDGAYREIVPTNIPKRKVSDHEMNLLYDKCFLFINTVCFEYAILSKFYFCAGKFCGHSLTSIAYHAVHCIGL